MKFLVYKDPWHVRGHHEVRTASDATVYKCTTRKEANRVAHALNTKPARVSIDDVLADLVWVSPQAVVKRQQPRKTESILDDVRNAEKFLIHPDLARNAKVEWPPDDVDLDK